MTQATRYAGRRGGEGIDDSLSGPETVDATFLGAGSFIADPLSFPWHLIDDEQMRQPLIVDMRDQSDDDIVALTEVLPLLTRADVVVASTETGTLLSESLSLPEHCFIGEEPSDPHQVLAGLSDSKLGAALLREGLAPILHAELQAGAAPESRPLNVVEVGAPDRWHASMVPGPHRYISVGDLDDVPPESAELLLIDGAIADESIVNAAVRTLVPGGLMVFILGHDVVRSSDSRTFADISAAIGVVLGSNHVVEHVWGLYERPGRPPLGGIVAIHPLAATWP